MFKLLHFADAHIDMANYGRHDPQSGLPLRVMDFLKSLDTIVDTAIEEKVDLVIFAGDAYKDRAPAPTYQREWGRRVMRLSRSGIPTLLLVGNHDLSPALGRAHALENFDTLEVPNVRVLDRPAFLSSSELGLPVQVIALPWVSRSGLMASMNLSGSETGAVYERLGDRLIELVDGWLKERAEPDIPTIMTAHCSVQGAIYGGERTVMLGSDLVLPGSLVKDPRLDYVALGHIHKPQDLNEGAHPPVIYPGSIERVDFGEAKDDKFFVIAHIERSRTQVEWRQLKDVRRFLDRYVRLEKPEAAMQKIRQALPEATEIKDSILRLIIEYPRDLETAIDEAALREIAAESFEFHLVKRPQVQGRIRLPGDQAIGSLGALDLLDLYWKSNNTETTEREALGALASQIINQFHTGVDE